jgi:O-antigen/teichoic acid export membrane protein
MLKKILGYNYNIPNHYLIFLDQVVVSTGNFLISIIILRFLGLEVFGIFSFYWLFLLLIYGLQISYIISPMLTNAPKQQDSTINYFYGGVFFQQLIFTLLIFFIIFFSLIFLGNFSLDYQMEDYYLQFSLSIVSTQLHQFIRRLLLIKKLYHRALFNDFITYFSLIICLFYFNFLDLLTLEYVWWIIFYTFLFGFIINFSIIISLKYRFKNIHEAITENWIIAKWLLLTSLSQWFSGNLWLVNTGVILGPYIFGIIRACQTLLNVLNIFFQSIENFIPAEASKKFTSGGIKEMELYLIRFTRKYLIIILSIVILIILFSKYLLNFFYGLETSNSNQILIYLSLIIPFHFLQYPLNYSFRTLGKTKPIFIAYSCSAIFALLTSKFIITNFKIQGLIFGLYASQMLIITILYFSYYHLRKNIKKDLI